ncbi:hypothetical protein C4D60_Mb06t05660 [Musa balbisiana]|uniref:Formin-like protein n=1 Tax=Musa balbisiana TaxID=52838 RepID=A0A4S8IKT5_MUSBA|nr:hypothetical protein C4D60_Mb06t05660 [Musa balbisiana]
MASELRPLLLLPLFYLSCSLSLTLTSSQPTLQRNIETFFPSLPSPAFQYPPSPPAPSSLGPTNTGVTKAVVVAAVSSCAFCGSLFVVFYFFVARRREEKVVQPVKSARLRSLRSNASPARRRSAFVDDDGLDALYWREFESKFCSHCNKGYLFGPREDDDEERREYDVFASPPGNDRRIQENSLLPASFIDSSSRNFHDRSSYWRRPTQVNQQLPPVSGRAIPLTSRQSLLGSGSTSSQPPSTAMLSASHSPPPQSGLPWSPLAAPTETSNTSHPPRPPAPPSPPLPPTTKSNAATPSPPLPPVMKSNPAAPAPPPPPPVMKSNAAAPAPPPPPPATKSVPKPAPPSPPLPNNNNPAPAAPPPPPGGSRPGGAPSSGPPPPAPARTSAAGAADGGPKKLKPLHWDKMNPINVEHSMVWDKISNGSLKVDEDTMEALFGSAFRNRKAVDAAANPSTSKAAITQIVLLDPRRSQNIAIVLRSTAISRQDIIDGLTDGCGLSTDVLERLTKIAPTKDEEDLVLGYTGDPSKLADAESFLFYILHAVTVPFARLDAMLFRSNYALEVATFKRYLQVLEQACKELKTPTRGPFLKLLETVLKAGNRMNAGTARGNAHAFNLTALLKLADVKSSDGSTTLLHFVVEEVVRSEGKSLVVNRNYNLHRSNSGATLDRSTSRSAGREEREKEYIMLGLPIVGGLSDEFANLKRAAGIDYSELITTCPTLQARVTEIRRVLETCGVGGFTREMQTFVEEAEDELKAARGEQARVLELVKKTTEYYHAGDSNVKGAHPLQLFTIVKDFLDMVDKTCVDIARNIQQKKKKHSPAAARTGSGSTSASQSEPSSREGSERRSRPMARFPNLPPDFLYRNSMSDSSSDED